MSLLTDPLVQVLLTHDVTLCGSIVREWLAGTTMDDFHGIVVGRVNHGQWRTVNRVLYPFIAMMTVEIETSNGIQTMYHLRSPEQRLKVRLYFEKVKYMHFPRRGIDVNRLCLTRDGLQVESQEFDKEPVPLARLWNQCIQRQFRLCQEPMLNDTVWKVKRVQSLLDQGWTYLDSCVALVHPPYPDDVCAICQDAFDSNVMETSCNHCFHQSCWEQHVASKITTTAFSISPLQVSCPLCREKFYPWQIIMPKKIYG